jgi:type III restriction enzyme
MRFTLDTVGKLNWPPDSQGRPIHPEGFAELAEKLHRPLDPPGRDVRCIISVGMLTEGWDCNTVTHIVGLRPFMSQLLCEQVVGRGLRRASYDIDESSGEPRFTEEVAQILGVPFEIIPLKARKGSAPQPAVRRNHVHALPSKEAYEIRFPRVERYTQAIRNRITVDWDSVPSLPLKPDVIPPEVEMKSSLPLNSGRPSLYGPGKISRADLERFRSDRRIQELVFDLSTALTRQAIREGRCDIPAHVLFPQLAAIVHRYVDEKVNVQSPATKKDLFLAPYYGWLEERIRLAIRPDAASGEAPEIPLYETSRGPGSTADVDFWTSRDVREVHKSHVNFVVADTKKWEQQAAYYLDRHVQVAAFAKNAGLGFAIPYYFDHQAHDYQPDFIVRLAGETPRFLILETKGFDPREAVKIDAAKRWVTAVNAEGSYGSWAYAVAKKISDIDAILDLAVTDQLDIA